MKQPAAMKRGFATRKSQCALRFMAQCAASYEHNCIAIGECIISARADASLKIIARRVILCQFHKQLIDILARIWYNNVAWMLPRLTF